MAITKPDGALATTEVDPTDYFTYIKSKKKEMTDDFLTQFETVISNELDKAMTIGQTNLVRRLAFTVAAAIKERELLKSGINVYVLQEDIMEYIKNVADKAVKIIEMEFYPRSIPDEIVHRVKELQEAKIFDRFYIVFTDYTDEVTKQVQEERKRKDPILFGTFEHKIDDIWDIHDRFYFVGDWEDEYCDLTLTKMVEAMSKKGKNIVRSTEFDEATPETVRNFLNRIEEQERGRFMIRPQKKKSFFEKVSTIWKTIKE